jgi:hypothetical protein
MGVEVSSFSDAASGRRVVHLVTTGQVTFALFIAFCVALSPHYVLGRNEGGISNFGVHAKTVVPYSIALLTPALLSFGASRLGVRANPRRRQLRCVLVNYSALLLLTLLTTYTYKINTALKDIHVGVGAIITVFEMGASLWMYRELRAMVAVLLVEFVGFVLATLTIFGALHLLFVTQMMVGVAFAVFLIQTCRSLVSPTNASARPTSRD